MAPAVQIQKITVPVPSSSPFPPQWVKKRSNQLIRRSALASVGSSTLAAQKRIQESLAASSSASQASRTLTLGQSPAAAKLRMVVPGARVEINGVAYTKSARGNKFTRVGAETPRTSNRAPQQQQPGKQTVVIRGLAYVRDALRPNKLVLKTVSDAATAANAVTKQQKQSSYNMPKAIEIGGKVYVRTVNGNLRLASSKSQRRKSVPNSRPSKATKFCTYMTRWGKCPRGAACLYRHSPAHRAVCPMWLLNRPHDEATCRLTHVPNENNRPLCRHFQTSRGCRNGVSCRFLHAKMPERATVCKEFAFVGWCDKGDACEHKHYRICPDEEDRGHCDKADCKMPHSKKGPKAKALQERKRKAGDKSSAASGSVAGDDDQLFGFDFEDNVLPDPEDEEVVDMDISSDLDDMDPSDMEENEDEEGDENVELEEDDEIERAEAEEVHEGTDADTEGEEVSGSDDEAPDVIVLEEGEDFEDENDADPRGEESFIGLGIDDGDDEDEVDYEIDEPAPKRKRTNLLG